jgi:UDP-N-acetylglucosamine--N-acetylmuramyl-(pentapeptide) pyrophosphoryl-undecaprenol N-acetylglucosamine transferase
LSRTIMIMAGGTGGHVFPGLAVADYMQAAGWRVVWLGTRKGMEATLVPQHGFPIELICFSGLRGKKWRDYLLLPWRLQQAFWQSLQILRRQRPHVVLGMGGYPALPGGMMAVLLGKPLLIHEQNTIAGLTNKILAKLADRILLGFPGTIAGHKNKIQVTGNPIRPDIAQLPSPEKRYAERTGKLKILVIGGSLGAQKLNAVLPQALSMIPEDQRPLVTHQSGKAHLTALQQAYADHGVAGNLVAFIEDMAAQYSECDLVICRAGALTVSELAAAGVASILVPYPHAVDDHQTVNARFLSDRHAAVLWPQTELTAASLAQWLMACTRAQLQIMAMHARALAAPEATRLVAEACQTTSGATE